MVGVVGAIVMAAVSLGDAQGPRPRVVIISLDGARPALVEQYLKRGVIDDDTGLGRLRARGVSADQHVTVTPSVTAVAHIAIATGSGASRNNIPGNTFHPVAATIGTSLSGFGAPIGGYRISPLGISPSPTAEPLWVQLAKAGQTAVTATWPGGDGVDVRISGTVVQAATPTRTTAYSVPFGAFGGLGARGHALTAANFVPAGPSLVADLAAAGHPSFSPVQVSASPIETVFCAPGTSSSCGTTDASGRTLEYAIHLAALDTTNDGVTNYDVLAVFSAAAGIQPGPFGLPSTGPAYIRASGPSDTFFFEGSGNRVGTSFFVTRLAPDLSTVRIARYSANFIPRNAPVLAVVDDINANVGFWMPQPDFRIPERLSPGFGVFPDEELEAIYLDQIATFTDYQARLALHAIAKNRSADLVMVYFEQPDGAGHQFTLTDPRQASDPANPASVNIPAPGATGQDPLKVARYARYLEFAYQSANAGVQRILDAVGVDKHGEPLSDVFVVSDHGMAPFHTAVQLASLLSKAGVDLTKIGIRTTGPAANIYVNLQGREAGGTVTPAEYSTVVSSVAAALRAATDPNPYYNNTGAPLFTDVWTRPLNCGEPGFCTDAVIGQDSGDLVALMAEGYNFDGTQSPAVGRLGDAGSPDVFSVPNFYGAHGHNSDLPSMSAILYAAGPNIKQGQRLKVSRNIDVAPTVLRILGVSPPPTMEGDALLHILRK
jgi:hypothetical protein